MKDYDSLFDRPAWEYSEEWMNVKNVSVWNGVTSIGTYALFAPMSGSGPHIETVTLADSVVAIRENAFTYAKTLKSVTFGQNSELRVIGSHAFYCCSSLKEVEIPDSVVLIADNAFLDCEGIESVVFGPNIRLTSL